MSSTTRAYPAHTLAAIEEQFVRIFVNGDVPLLSPLAIGAGAPAPSPLPSEEDQTREYGHGGGRV